MANGETVPVLVGGIGEINFGKQFRQGNRIYSASSVAMALLSSPVGNTGGYSYLYQVKTQEKDGMSQRIRVRKLTPMECFRLMGFTDEDFLTAKTGTRENAKAILAKYPKHSGKRIMTDAERISRMSNSQLYKQAGNSIVVDVLVYIMNNLKNAMPYLFEDVIVGSFFSGIGAFEAALRELDRMECKNSEEAVNPELTQIGYINDYNGDANRIYDSTVARTLKAEAGGGGAKTGWYRVNE